MTMITIINESHGEIGIFKSGNMIGVLSEYMTYMYQSGKQRN